MHNSCFGLVTATLSADQSHYQYHFEATANTPAIAYQIGNTSRLRLLLLQMCALYCINVHTLLPDCLACQRAAEATMSSGLLHVLLTANTSAPVAPPPTNLQVVSLRLVLVLVRGTTSISPCHQDQGVEHTVQHLTESYCQPWMPISRSSSWSLLAMMLVIWTPWGI